MDKRQKALCSEGLNLDQIPVCYVKRLGISFRPNSTLPAGTRLVHNLSIYSIGSSHFLSIGTHNILVMTRR